MLLNVVDLKPGGTTKLILYATEFRLSNEVGGSLATSLSEHLSLEDSQSCPFAQLELDSSWKSICQSSHQIKLKLVEQQEQGTQIGMEKPK